MRKRQGQLGMRRAFTVAPALLTGALLLVTGVCAADPGGPSSTSSYHLGRWTFGPLVLGLILSVLAIGYVLRQRRKEKAAGLPNAPGTAHLRLLLLSLLALYLLFDLFSILHAGGLVAPSSAVDNLDSPQKLAAIEAVFGPFRNPLREGSLKAIAGVTGILFALNFIGGGLNFVVLGGLLIPGVPNLAYAAWGQGATLATFEASTFGSMLCFLILLALETITYVLFTAAGMHLALSLLSPAWCGAETRAVSLRRSSKTALKICAVCAVVLLVQALCETLYVQQVLLHGGSGVPLRPY